MSILFISDFANNTVLLRFFFFFLIIELYFLIPAATAQIFNPTAELAIPKAIPIEEVKAEIEIHLVIVEAKIKSVQYNLELYKPFCTVYSSIHFVFFLQENNFLFHLYSLI